VPLGTPSSPAGPLDAGSYSFEAVYSGDTNYTGSTSVCEHFTVTPAATATSTVLHDAAPPNSVIAVGGSVPPGTSVFDSASVSGQVGGKAITGTVTYHFFTTVDCTGTSSAELVPLGAPSSPTGPLAAGSYSFEAVYSGDTNYTGSTSACEHFNVQLPTSQITRGGSTCQEFVAGTSTPLPAGHYSIKGTTINGVNPGVFSYYTAVVAPGTTFTTSILQTNDSGVVPSYPNVPIDNHQVVVYNSACQIVTSGVTPSFPSVGDADVKITGATTGATYIVSVKYSLTSLKGQRVPPKNPLTYTFSTDLNGTMINSSRQNLLFETP
jgi:hypothetical protein